jgi:hypothetical protein
MADVRTEYSQLAEKYDEQWDAYSLRTTEAVLEDARLRATLLERPHAWLLDVATGRCCSSQAHILFSNALVHLSRTPLKGPETCWRLFHSATASATSACNCSG